MKKMLFLVLFYEILCTFMAKVFEQWHEIHRRSILVSGNKPKPCHACRGFLAVGARIYCVTEPQGATHS